MTIDEVAAEALAYVKSLSPEDKGNLLAIVAMPKETVLGLLKEAQGKGNAEAIRFMGVAFFLHATVSALRTLEEGK